MNNRQRQDLDNYITGHYGEDQMRQDWDNLSGHEAAFSSNPMAGVFTYDPADDGPECEVITRILASHNDWDLAIEWGEHMFGFSNPLITPKRTKKRTKYPLGKRFD